MGTYLNPGSGRYEIALHGEIYVDKSQMISYLNSIISTPQRFISVSRPRRFGKTMAADMICAYYDRSINSHVLFENKKLADTDNWEVYINAFNVIRVVMTDFVRVGGNIEQGLVRLKERILEEFQ